MEKNKTNKRQSYLFLIIFAKKTMSRFNEIAKNWDAHPRRLLQAEKIFNAIENKVNLNNKMHVLDIGTGTGLLLMHFITKVKEITGIDNSKGMLEMLQEKVNKNNVNNVNYILFDADKDNLPENRFDLAVSSMTFHHIKDTEKFLKEIYKSLKSGSKVCIGDLETEDGSFHSNPDESIKHFGFDKNEFTVMMEKARFKNVSVETIFEIEKPEKKYPIFLAYGEK
ncbi:MAG: class I SAM-dependent methyltransferase [Chlorobi bacterium]|nr:class I SAM-dependent methyltransferase [Chlorobiota bacterium]